MLVNTCPEDSLPRDAESSAVTELPLLLPAWQVEALQEAAQTEGITVGQLLRRVVNRTLAQRSLHQPGYYCG